MGMLKTGHKTIISIGGTNFEEIDIGVPGINAGGGIDTTTQRNTLWRTMAPKELVTLDEIALTVAYDATKLGDIYALAGVNTLLTITTPDATAIAFWGFVNTFKPNPLQEGQRPTAAMTIVPTMTDDDGVETAPVVTPG